jgi:hypothetical protein
MADEFDEEEYKRRRHKRSIAIGWALAAIVVLFFIVTMVRIGSHVTTVVRP